MNPSAATTAWAGRRTGSWPSTVISISDTVGSPKSPVTWALVMISALESRTAWTVRSWARKASRRWTRVMELATGSRLIAQSNAESPPPTITTSLPAYGAKLGTKNSMPRPSQPSPAGSGRGLNLPMPAVIRSAFAVTVLPSSSVIVTSSSVLFQPARGAVQDVLRLGRVRLLHELVDQIAPLDRREPGDVEDLLLRIHRGDLAAELGQRVDDGDAEITESGVVGGEQSGRSRADDGQVGVVVWHVATLPHRACSRSTCPPRVRAPMGSPVLLGHVLTRLDIGHQPAAIGAQHRHQRPPGGVRRGAAAGGRPLVEEQQRQDLVRGGTDHPAGRDSGRGVRLAGDDAVRAPARPSCGSGRPCRWSSTTSPG